MPTIPDQINAGMDALVEKAGRGLVQVHNGRGAGAGTIWHSEGLVLTNAHVAGRGPLQVTLRGGATVQARLLASDTERDLAALAVEGGDLPIVELGESISLRPGQWVLALGHPFGVTGAATAGVGIGGGSAAGRRAAAEGRLDSGQPTPPAGIFRRAAGGRGRPPGGDQYRDDGTRRGIGRARPRCEGVPSTDPRHPGQVGRLI